MPMTNKPGMLDMWSVLSCMQASLYVAALLDGTLDESRQDALRIHLDGCRSCKRMLLTAYAHRQQAIAADHEDTAVDLDQQRLPSWLAQTLAEEARKRA